MDTPRDGQILQRQSCQVKYGNAGRLAIKTCVARQNVANFFTRGVIRPLRFADLPRLGNIIDYEARTFEQSGRKFTLATRVGADTIEVRAGPDRRHVEQRSAPRRCSDHNVAVRHCLVWIDHALYGDLVSEMGLEASVRTPIPADVPQPLDTREDSQCIFGLGACLYTGTEHAQLRAVATCQRLEAECTGGGGAGGRDGISIKDTDRPTRSGIDQHDRRLMRLASSTAIGGPESGCLESQESL